MKLKAIIGCVLVAAMLMVVSPALALSLGVSPTQVELEVPGNGSATANVKVHYFSGDVKISLVDIPLRVEPETIHVEASDEPVAIELTIYGDSTLGSKIYDGYIMFIAVSGGAATGGVQVIAKVTNMVEGATPTKALTVEESALEVTPPEPAADEPAPASPTASDPPGPPAPTSPTQGQVKVIPLIWAIAGTIVVAILIAVVVRKTRRMRWLEH